MTPSWGPKLSESRRSTPEDANPHSTRIAWTFTHPVQQNICARPSRFFTSGWRPQGSPQWEHVVAAACPTTTMVITCHPDWSCLREQGGIDRGRGCGSAIGWSRRRGSLAWLPSNSAREHRAGSGIRKPRSLRDTLASHSPLGSPGAKGQRRKLPRARRLTLDPDPVAGVIGQGEARSSLAFAT